MNSVDPLQRFLCDTPHFRFPGAGYPVSPQEFQLDVAQGTHDPILRLNELIHAFYRARGWTFQLAPWCLLRNTGLDLQIFHPTEGFQLRYITATMLAGSRGRIIVTVGYIANPIEKDGIPFYIGEEMETNQTRIKVMELGRTSVKVIFQAVGIEYYNYGFRPSTTYKICENEGGSWDIMSHDHTIYVKIDSSGSKKLELH